MPISDTLTIFLQTKKFSVKYMGTQGTTKLRINHCEPKEREHLNHVHFNADYSGVEMRHVYKGVR